MEKFKEKKANVVAALREGVDAMLASVPVQQQLEEILTVGLDSKNPAVKTETILMLTRSFSKSSPAMVPKPMLKQLCPILLKVGSWIKPHEIKGIYLFACIESFMKGLSLGINENSYSAKGNVYCTLWDWNLLFVLTDMCLA